MMALVNNFTRIGAHTSVDVDDDPIVTLTKPAKADGIMMQARTNDLLYTLDGTDPAEEDGDSGTGFLLDADAPPTFLALHPNMTLKFIEKASASAGTLVYQWIKLL